MNSIINQVGRRSPRDQSLRKVLQSPAIMASGFSTKFLSSNSNEFCDRLKLLLQQKQTGNNSNTTDEEIIAIADKLLE